MENKELLKLAQSHGLQLKETMTFNDMGIDFKICFATASDGKDWVLRIPRRADLEAQILQEAKILRLVKNHITASVPDWQIVHRQLMAYPLLENKPVLTYDALTYEVTWNMDRNAPGYLSSLASLLVELHRIPVRKAEVLQLKTLSPEMSRKEMLERLELVKKELGIGKDLEKRWRTWLDNNKLWPEFTAFIHGDLFAGHILASSDGTISGVIDWSEGQVNDISIDFAGHLAVFGEASLKALISAYERSGGKVWDHLYDQTVERSAASPLNYAHFAIGSRDEGHIRAARQQLRLS